MKSLVKSFILVTLFFLILGNFSFSQDFWQPKSTAGSANVNAIAIRSNGDLFLATNGDGLFRSTDGGESWSSLATTHKYFYSVLVTDDGVVYAGSYDGMFYISTNNGVDWTSTRVVDNDTTDARGDTATARSIITSIVRDNEGNIYVATGVEGIFVSQDDGKSWISLGTNFYNSATGIINAPLSMLLDAQRNLHVGTYRGGTFTFNSRRSQWQSENISIFSYYRHTIRFTVEGRDTCANTTRTIMDRFVYNITRYGDSIVIDLPPFAGIFNDTCINQGTVTSTPIDTVVEVVYSRLSPSSDRVNAFAVGPNGTLYIGTDFGVFRSETFVDSSRSAITPDTLQYWKEVDLANFEKYVLSLAVSSNGTIYAGTFGDGVYRSDNNGLTWEAVNTGISTVEGSRMTLALSPQGYLFCGTKDGRVYRSAQPVSAPQLIQSGNNASKIPGGVILEPSYPNPFNATTVIPFTLKKSGYTEVKIYNSLGQEVTKLISGNLDEGRYEIRWDASAYPSGIYFYRVQSAASIEVGRLALMK